MADFDNQPSPPNSPPRPQPPLPAAGKPPTKRKDPPPTTETAAASSTGPSPNKRPNIIPRPQPPPPPLPFLPLLTAAAPGDVQDTATSKLLDVELPDLEILQSMMEHHKKRGKFPIEDPDEMRAFILPYTIKSIGTEKGWKEKMKKLKKKYNLDSQPVEEEEKKEFDLWRKIWGKDGGDDRDPSGGAVGV
ncbi:hypothetical protein OSB04_015676 [Centaurea solstitialis]|uniref:Glabrous enhancer-binding protein-like DBD domain-containing protein n=1 Tax=Centaurea solstitialis TaxID=347529 RepID=A0AA38WKC6_9ASTR|nr:hypothetical protein OSB04_015676 [Centaurea solstitialis]